MLDPHSINSIRFSTTRLREGYDQDEVDDYLDKVVAELETLQRQLAEAEETNRSLRTRNERLSSFPTSAMKPVPIVEADRVRPDNVVAPPVKTEKAPPHDFANVGFRSGDVGVSLVSVTSRQVQYRDFRARTTKDEMLCVTVKITNHSQTRRLDYRGWAAPLGRHWAMLFDEHGNQYKTIDFGLGSRVEGQTRDAVSINPGDSLDDLLVFEKPLALAQTLTLTLPLGAIEGQRGELKGTIPREFSR